MRCLLSSIYLTLRYGLFRGRYISGHHMVFTGKTWFDYYLMECHICGRTAASELGPNGKWEEL